MQLDMFTEETPAPVEWVKAPPPPKPKPGSLAHLSELGWEMFRPKPYKIRKEGSYRCWIFNENQIDR
jgi:hypothetical protein